jgi:hypothetical protein
VRPLAVVVATAAVAAVAAVGCSTQPHAAVATVAEAYPTYRALHEAIVTPTCGPRGGVCHNSKQFPDLHTPENMLAVIGQRCNQLTEDPLAMLDQCEPPGDLLVVRGGPDAGLRTRIGYVTVDPASPPAWVQLTTHDPIAHDGTAIAFSIVRDADPAHPLEIPFPPLLTTAAGQRSVTITTLPSLTPGQRAFVTAPYAPGLDAEVQLGDPNRNGSFGFDLGFALIQPGAPARSFLVQRILGTVAPRMPLANGDLTADEIYALQCWIAQLAPDASNADGPIDYARCPASF